jgi:O-antigen/teichoic acid export membrane protein
MLRNGLYNIIGSAIRLILSLITIPLVINLIGIEEYGLWSLVSSLLAVIGLAEGGLSVSTTVFLSKDIANHDNNGVSQTLSITGTVILFTATLIVLVLLIFSDFTVNIFPNLETSQIAIAISALKFGALVVWAKLLQQLAISIEQSYQRYGLMNILNTLQVALISIGMIVIAYWGGKTLALMQWQAFTSLVMLLMHIGASISLLKEAKPKFIWSNTKGLKIARYSIATWFTSIGTALFQQGDRLIIGSVLDTKLLGVYAAIISITTQINVFSSIAVQPLLPRLNKLLEGSRTHLEEQIKVAFQVNIILALILGGILLIFTPTVVNLLFAKNASDEYALLFRISVIVYSLYSFNAVGYYILLGLGYVNTSMFVVMSSGIFSLICIFFGAKELGLLGVTIGNAGYIGTNFCMYIAMNHLSIPMKKWISWIYPMEILFLMRNLFDKLSKIQI